MQEIFRVDPSSGYNWLGDAMNATDLSDMFGPDAVSGMHKIDVGIGLNF